ECGLDPREYAAAEKLDARSKESGVRSWKNTTPAHPCHPARGSADSAANDPLRSQPRRPSPPPQPPRYAPATAPWHGPVTFGTVERLLGMDFRGSRSIPVPPPGGAM